MPERYKTLLNLTNGFSLCYKTQPATISIYIADFYLLVVEKYDSGVFVFPVGALWDRGSDRSVSLTGQVTHIRS